MAKIWEIMIVVFITLGLIGVELAINKWIRKVTNTYWFWLGVSIFYITWCITITWARYWSYAATFHFHWGTPLDREESRLVSNVFLFNICPLLNFLLPVTLIADPSRKACRALAPIALLASAIVLFGDIPMSGNVEISLRYFFVGRADFGDLYWFGHAMNFFISLGVVMNTPKISWKGLVGTYSSLFGIWMYALIGGKLTGVQAYVSGMNLNDFIYGVYSVFGKYAPPQVAAAVFFIGFLGAIFGLTLLLNVCKKGYFSYGDKYSGCWWHYYDYKKVSNNKSLNLLGIRRK